MRTPKEILLIATVTTMELPEVLSPESHVFVALMSVEEGPNKAVFLAPIPLSMSAPQSKIPDNGQDR